MSTILLLGAFDTKGPDYQFVRELFLNKGHEVLTLNTGVMGGTTLFPIDIHAEEVAREGGEALAALQLAGDRGGAMKVMARGAAQITRDLYDQGKIEAVFGMGGSGGTSVIATAMRSLPLGVPKVCVSTTASGDTSAFVETKDVVLFPSITDVAGVNRVSRMVYTRAVGALCGMLEMEMPSSEADKPIITASMFGNTTECVGLCEKGLQQAGYEVLIFHAVGSGGRALEDLVAEGLVAGVLDITTTEWADELCGGVFSAGQQRLQTPGQMGIPHLIVPGCIDMVNFYGKETIPVEYHDRNLYAWNPNVTLMRTTPEENAQLGEIFAQIANHAQGPVRFLIPTKGFSILDSVDVQGEAQLFWDPEADQAFVDSLKQHVNPSIPVEEMAVNINDPAFAKRAVEVLLEMVRE